MDTKFFVTFEAWSASDSLAQHIFPGPEVLMVAKYDIFKKINESLVWVEAVEDIGTAKKRLTILASDGRYRIWDSAEQRFIDVPADNA